MKEDYLLRQRDEGAQVLQITIRQLNLLCTITF